MKIIAVTGAQGFVGSAIVQELTRRGHRVIPLVRHDNGTYKDAVAWDITTPYAGPPLSVDAVVHTAAKVDDWASYDESRKGNVTGTENVLAVSKDARQFIYISSASVYDPTNKETVITETSPAGTNLLNAYSKTKYEAEQVVLRSQIPSRIIIRPHVIYGPGDTTVLPRLLRAHRFGRFLILGDGMNHISLTHIHNLAESIAQLVASDQIFSGEVFNICDGESYTVNEAIDSLKKTLGITSPNLHITKRLAYLKGALLEGLYKILGIKYAPLITRYIVEQMTSNHIIDCSKAKRLFGYSPKARFPEGIN